MLRPSYAELMNVLNQNTDDANEITSRYTIVIASAKRARQLIDGDEPMVTNYKRGKPLSTAVQELWEGKIKIVPEGQGTVLDLHKETENNTESENDKHEDDDISDFSDEEE